MSLVAALPVISLLLGAFYLAAGILKVTGNAHMIEEFENFGYPQWLRVLAGGIELVAAPLMLCVIWFPTLAGIGALLMCPVMLGATYTNFAKRPAAYGWGTVVLLLLCALLAFYGYLSSRHGYVVPWAFCPYICYPPPASLK